MNNHQSYALKKFLTLIKLENVFPLNFSFLKSMSSGSLAISYIQVLCNATYMAVLRFRRTLALAVLSNLLCVMISSPRMSILTLHNRNVPLLDKGSALNVLVPYMVASWFTLWAL